MRRSLVLFFVLAVAAAGTARGQSFMDYIQEMRGDTAVVKDYVDMGNVANSLISAIQLDNNATDDRVYLLKRDGYYWQDRQLVLPARKMTIMGEYAPVVGGTAEQGAPPIIVGTADAQGTTAQSDLLQPSADLTLKNVAAQAANTQGGQGWTIFTTAAPNLTLTFENVLFEHTNWVFIQSNQFAGTKLYIRDSYFVNMSGYPCRRNGGVYDNVDNTTDVIHVENSTHVMASGMMYKFRSYPINRLFFNHNTFVNAVGILFPTFGYQINWTLTNNLFVNSNVQAYHPGLDIEETDQDQLPTGIVNVNTLANVNVSLLPQEFRDASPAERERMRKMLVDRNGIFWDSRLLDATGTDLIVQWLNQNFVKDRADYRSQMITMNTRTQGMFDDNENYPLLTEGTWIRGGDPGFVRMDDQISNIIAYVRDAPRENMTINLAKWRDAGNPADPDNFAFPDWPVNADLAYTNPAYLSAALGNLPLGDLNWFPELKAKWAQHKDALDAELQAALDEGRVPQFANIVSVEQTDREIPEGFSLAQNYPNPFNPSTRIEFAVPRQTHVSIEVFDLNGRRVATLVDRSMAPGTYNVTWDALTSQGRPATSGVYLYRLRAGDVLMTKQMVLIK
jgi:hypothetical protein